MARYPSFGAKKKNAYKSHSHAVPSGIEDSPPGTPPGTPTSAVVAATAVVAVLLTPKNLLIQNLTNLLAKAKRKARTETLKSKRRLKETQLLRQSNLHLRTAAASSAQFAAAHMDGVLSSDEDVESIVGNLIDLEILDESTAELVRAGVLDRKGALMSDVEGHLRTLWGVLTFENDILPKLRVARSSRSTKARSADAVIFRLEMDEEAKRKARRRLQKMLHGFIEFAMFVRPSIQKQLMARMKQSLHVDFSPERIGFLMGTSSSFNLTALQAIVALETKEKHARGTIATPKQV
ncbi:hypothetical protein B484DRAFT_427887 [Ochromonadaceae sp. CCMP2298]|nr:hypothetical protein B484DRAFT_427887 [Ochromonadaceae sp. CCMP2298]